MTPGNGDPGATTFADKKLWSSLRTTGAYDIRADWDLDGVWDWRDNNDYNASFDMYGGRGDLTRRISGSSYSTVDNRLGYAGYVHDPFLDGGVMHVRHRVYHAGLGRWGQRDPLGYVDGLSLYGYVRIRPILSTDPLGLCVAQQRHPCDLLDNRIYTPRQCWSFMDQDPPDCSSYATCMADNFIYCDAGKEYSPTAYRKLRRDFHRCCHDGTVHESGESGATCVTEALRDYNTPIGGCFTNCVINTLKGRKGVYNEVCIPGWSLIQELTGDAQIGSDALTPDQALCVAKKIQEGKNPWLCFVPELDLTVDLRKCAVCISFAVLGCAIECNI